MISIGLVGLFLLATSIAAAAFADQLTTIGFQSTWRGLTCDQKDSLQNYLDCCALDNEHKGANYSECGDGEFAYPQCGNSLVLTSIGVGMCGRSGCVQWLSRCGPSGCVQCLSRCGPNGWVCSVFE